MTNCAEWLRLEKEFREFQQASPNLLAVWSSLDNKWIRCTMPEGEADHFRALIAFAAVAAGHRGREGAVEYWLNLVKSYLLERKSESILIEPHFAKRGDRPGVDAMLPEGESDDPHIRRGEIHTIQPLCRASADYCLYRASQVRSDEHAERSGLESSIKSRHRKNEAIEEVRVFARKMRAEGATHQQICQRLKNEARPPRAEWRHLPWDKAYMDERHRASVCKWLSKNCQP